MHFGTAGALFLFFEVFPSHVMCLFKSREWLIWGLVRGLCHVIGQVEARILACGHVIGGCLGQNRFRVSWVFGCLGLGHEKKYGVFGEGYNVFMGWYFEKKKASIDSVGYGMRFMVCFVEKNGSIY